jgi:hypothetical protein
VFWESTSPRPRSEPQQPHTRHRTVDMGDIEAAVKALKAGVDVLKVPGLVCCESVRL